MFLRGSYENVYTNRRKHRSHALRGFKLATKRQYPVGISPRFVRLVLRHILRSQNREALMVVDLSI